MSKRFKKLSHTIYECKYHFAICPKYRFRIFKGELAEYTKQQISLRPEGITGGTGIECAGGSHPAGDVHRTEVFCIFCDGISEREAVPETVPKI